MKTSNKVWGSFRRVGKWVGKREGSPWTGKMQTHVGMLVPRDCWWFPHDHWWSDYQRLWHRRADTSPYMCGRGQTITGLLLFQTSGFTKILAPSTAQTHDTTTLARLSGSESSPKVTATITCHVKFYISIFMFINFTYLSNILISYLSTLYAYLIHKNSIYQFWRFILYINIERVIHPPLYMPRQRLLYTMHNLQ